MEAVRIEHRSSNCSYASYATAVVNEYKRMYPLHNFKADVCSYSRVVPVSVPPIKLFDNLESMYIDIKLKIGRGYIWVTFKEVQ